MTGARKTRGRLDVEKYRQRLQEMKAQLETDLANAQQDEVTQDGGPAEPGPGQHWEHTGYGDHLADDATELFEREKLLALDTTLRAHLRQVDRALKAIDEGTYGRCEVCGRPIGADRLRAIPETTLCLEHKAAAERQAGAASSAGA
jgi:RNA polymerase-binding transcription factor DksA